MNSKNITFNGALNEKLSAKLDMPEDGSPKACALFAHCFTCSKNLHAVRNISKALNNKNIAVFRFDFTGLGQSGGDFSKTNFSSNIEDLVAAANYMKENMQAPEILIGHSMGGPAVIRAAHDIDSAKVVSTVGATCDPEHVTHHFGSYNDVILKEGEAVVEIAGRPFKIRKQFLEDLKKTNMKGYIENLKRPLLLFHSPTDNTVSISNATDIFMAAKHPKSFISLDNADHLLSNERDSRFVGSMLGTWVDRYLDV